MTVSHEGIRNTSQRIAAIRLNVCCELDTFFIGVML